MDYGRLVSYIYQYENGIKGKNIGFAKVETRNRQCKISINLKGVYTDNPVNYSVYLFANNTQNISGIKIGEILVRNGIGTLQEIIYSDNINDTGYSYKEISGLFIAYRDNVDDMLISQWTDEQINLSDVRFNARKEGVAESDSETQIESTNEIQSEIQANTQSEIQAMDNREVSDIVEAKQVHLAKEEERQQVQVTQEEEQQPYVQSMQEQQSAHVQLAQEHQQSYMQAMEEESQSHIQASQEVQQPQVDQVLKTQSEGLQVSKDISQSELNVNSTGIAWFSTHNIIDAFEDDEYYDCIEICPDDLKTIDISEIDVPNNSFLMHGYYNFKHILFGKINRQGEENNYFVGVPGVYSNRERFMASMYGFNNFRRSHRSDYRNPYFGYWYVEIYA